MVISPLGPPTILWCGIASRTHILYGAAWIRKMLADSGTSEATIKVTKPKSFLGTPAIALDDIRAALPASVTVAAWEDDDFADTGPIWCLSVGAVGIKPWFRLQTSHLRTRVPVVVTDEGLGSYGTWRSRREAWRRQGVHEPWRSLRTAAVSTATRILTSERWALHQETPAGWELNQDIVNEFRLLGTRTAPTRKAVFLSQPWPELGVMSENAYLDHVAEVADVCGRAGLEFSVHPHPAEDPHRYSAWSTMAKRPLAELDHGTINAAVVIGTSSTALINLSAIHHTPVIRVATPELSKLDEELSPRQASLLLRHAGPSVPSKAWPSTLTKMLAT